jgi:hypothetical protein
MKHSSVYLVIDFECFQPNLWQSVGILLYDADNHCLVREFHTACERGGTKMSTATRDFWRQHPCAFLWNCSAGKTKLARSEEIRICAFIEQAKADYPNFFLISDNPEYDVGMLNNILERNGHALMSRRNSRTYFQSICTWSSKRILDLLGIPIWEQDLLQLPPMPVDTDLAHTPLYDCRRVLNTYLCLLSTIAMVRSQNAQETH